MTLALVCMSHSPLLEAGEPPEEVRADVESALSAARAFVEEYEPELVVAFAPDHYNGFFYELMPQFCIGYEASGVGDFGSDTTPYDVPAEAADLAASVIDAGVDVAVSLKMQVDHGAVQPLELLFGSVAAAPVIPIFVNSVAPPFAPMHRVRLLGEAVGRYLSGHDKRVLVIGSGGLSHDPPVPQLATATEQQQRALLLDGRNPTPEARAQREQRVKAAALAFARGEAGIQDLNPDWDRAFLDVCASGQTTLFDRYRAADMAKAAGNSVHEVRTWVAAYSALRAAGPYRMTSSYYRAIPELIAGFAVTTAVAA